MLYQVIELTLEPSNVITANTKKMNFLAIHFEVISLEVKVV
jgi:hypothetical protein